MKDFARSEDRAVQAQLDRLAALTLPQGRLGLATMRALLGRLGDPHLRLPPVFHVAGTNGKGSTCAFLRAMLEAAGHRVHVTTSPHLVRYNERIRVAGALITDARLAEVLAQVLDAGEDLSPSFFEVTIAAAFVEFARVPADACVVEVGLGGRFDATNVIPRPAVCGIAALGIDHERFLLAPEDGVPADPMARIAFEKAGIAKSGAPLVTLGYATAVTQQIEDCAEKAGAPLLLQKREWDCGGGAGGLSYRDRTGKNGVEKIDLPWPTLPGAHQADNAGLAAAMIRHQNAIEVGIAAIADGCRTAVWPARLQRLSPGPVARAREIWLDGGHNPNAGAALAAHFAGSRLHLVIGMIAGKDPAAIVGPLEPNIASLTAVPVPGHDWQAAESFGCKSASAPDVHTALATIPDDGLPVLIAGSLYLAGEILRLNNELPN